MVVAPTRPTERARSQAALLEAIAKMILTSVRLVHARMAQHVLMQLIITLVRARRVSLAQRVEPTSTIALPRRATMVAYVRTPSMATHAHAQIDTRDTNAKHRLCRAAQHTRAATPAACRTAARAAATTAAAAAAFAIPLVEVGT
eukprot:COSAG01_NODE_22479_length_854_cov_0.862252_1_plen_144_part_01